MLEVLKKTCVCLFPSVQITISSSIVVVVVVVLAMIVVVKVGVVSGGPGWV